MINLSDNQPVFLQIKAWIEDKILRGEWSSDTLLPSVRELSAKFRVNTNTVVHAYERMVFDTSIRSVRGVGFFVAEDAQQTIMARRRELFYTKTLPEFVRQMIVLGVDAQVVMDEYNKMIKDEK